MGKIKFIYQDFDKNYIGCDDVQELECIHHIK